MQRQHLKCLVTWTDIIAVSRNPTGNSEEWCQSHDRKLSYLGTIGALVIESMPNVEMQEINSDSI